MAETEIIFAVRESPAGGYEARALGHSIFTQSDTSAQLRANVQEAVRCHFEADQMPRVSVLRQVKEEVIAV